MKTRARSEKEEKVELVWDVVVDEIGHDIDVVEVRAGEIGGYEPVAPFSADVEMEDVGRGITGMDLDAISIYTGDEDEDDNGSGLPPIFFAKLPS